MFDFTKRKKFALIGMLVLVICVAVVNNKLQTQQSLSANADYTNYEEEQMRLHDGDVLVDSLNVSEVPGKSSDSAITKKTESESVSSGAVKETAVITSDDSAEMTNADVYFEEQRATLNMDRNQVISMLADVIAEAPDGAEKDNATKQKLKIIDYMNKEKVIENLIQTKGYADALVVITDTSVTVTVNKSDISQTDVAKICDIVMRETGRDAGQIVIQNKS
ncbi:SpoIIIAH-like family protein [Anaerovorax odorimutans]|uniref:SpoIIIAH-like family protein n=1 Tax=Anaerovorax odorimutans TaxID=109327 RepID=UPI00040F2B2D|nr:SpoIIIAH-like family protein [Anaerovorax odorimutans]